MQNNALMILSRPVVLLFALILVIVAVNIATLHWYPSAWVDEVSYSDPSVSVALGQGFRSTTWAGQNKTEFWASNAPLHQYMLVPWVSVFGVGMTAVRAVNLLYLVIASILLWQLLSLPGFVKDTWLKLACIGSLWATEVLAWNYRNGRPDMITVMLAIATAVVFFGAWERRKWIVFGVGFASVLAGIQLPPYIAILIAVAFVFSSQRKRIFTFGLAYGVGVVSGLVALLGFLYLNGSAYTFLTQTFASGFTITGDAAQALVFDDARVYDRMNGRLGQLLNVGELYVRGRSSLIFGAVLLALSGYEIVTRNQGRLGWKIVVAAILVPPGLLVLGRYPYYYTWMFLLPLCIGCFVMIQHLSRIPRIALSTVIVLLICLTGLPASLISVNSDQKNRQRDLEQLLTEHIAPTDWVYGDHEVYYVCKSRVAEFFSLSYAGGRGLPLFPDDQRVRITKLILKPGQFEGAVKKIGGDWTLEKSAQGLEIYTRTPGQPMRASR